LVPAFGDSPPSQPATGSVAPAAAGSAPPPAPAANDLPVPIDTLATLNDIFNQRDDRW
jgi:hypothetical protein